jgi:DUF1680 family protein
VSCCPTNTARLVSSLNGYLASHDDDGIRVHQYFGGRLDAVGPAGDARALDIETRYPEDGRIRLVVRATDASPWTLTLRVPAWSAGAAVQVNGEAVESSGPQVAIRRAWSVGDEVVLDLTVAPQWVHPHPEVDASRGCAAVRRGPVVYCLESVDNPGIDVNRVLVEPGAPLREELAELPWGPTTVIRAFGGEVVSPTEGDGACFGSDPYREGEQRHELRLLPYHLWANRGPSTMRVWLPGAHRPAADPSSSTAAGTSS